MHSRRPRDLGCDGTPDTCWEFDDDAGGVATTRKDEGCDGVFDDCSSCREEPSTGLTSCERDSDCDGVADDCVVYAKHPSGDFSFTARDVDCDGIADESCVHTTHDDAGKLLSQYRDDDCDGTPDRDCVTGANDEDATSVSPNGSYDFDCDGTLDLCRGFQVDSTNTEYSWWTDDACDGTPDSECKQITRDEQGRVVTERDDSDCDGVMDQCARRAYASSQDHDSTTVDFECDGEVVECALVVYDEG